MPKILVNDLNVYYEIHGEGRPLVFIHGAWMTQKMWDKQVEHFSKNFQVITYDVRGHGQTGGSSFKSYSIELFAEDLNELLKALKVQAPIVCGLSMGGMIAQAYASRFPENISALILSDTAVSTELTLNDKLLKYILAPKWMFLLTVRLLGMKKYTDFAIWYSRVSRSKEWIGEDEQITEYIKNEMLKYDVTEFNKIFAVLYDFKIQPIDRIKSPTLIINGEYESKSVFKHAEKMEKMIDKAQSVVIKGAGHVPNLEKAAEFNQVIEDLIVKEN
ncbi:alpha/beta fold hydrolase [Desulfuribacillus alkaliarsenatis]|uniref:AB hydrolase-1 domain-containing protein n=1 Tax=Desulfuribacillus alkaliarsenatis TaxID=766136 RepID=A0A1E5FYV6_9FIRM|nr:alpha/beta hydrolase [Desulfuribacillus alkaliarsenatis]OEF95681.1 hypothetical protein BHF68_11280 [Desulfuribacillus alkaliarsenatis]